MQLMNKFLHNRVSRQWLLAPIVIITIGLGWKYYWITFVVPIVMLFNMLSPLFARGRFVCGNICPRGAFFDRILRPLSKGRKIPPFLTNNKFRWFVFIAIFGNFILQALKQPFTAEHFGHLFWMMCTVTTVIAVVLGVLFSHRTWCAFCPVGTFISAIGKDVHKLKIDKNLCISCRLCEKVCPLNIKITNDKENGELTNSNCIKCQECVAVCPKKALQLA